MMLPRAASLCLPLIACLAACGAAAEPAPEDSTSSGASLGTTGSGAESSESTSSGSTTADESSTSAPDGSSTGPAPTGSQQLLRLRTPTDPDDTLVDIPVLVVLTPERFAYAQAEPDGSDLRFIADDVPLAFEVERWEPGGESILWLRVPSLATGEAEVWLQYADPNAPEPRPSDSVWSNGYGAVWHFSEAAGATAFADSTAFGNTASLATGRVANTPGRFADSVALDPEARLEVLSDASLNYATFTLEAWVRLEDISDLVPFGPPRRVIAKAGAYGVDAVQSDDFPRGTVYRPMSSTWVLGSTPLISGDWTHLRFVHSGETMAMYVDGVEQVTDLVDTPGITGNPVVLGRDLAGALDEVRLAGVPRTRAWIETEAASMDDSLIEFGSAEPL